MCIDAISLAVTQDTPLPNMVDDGMRAIIEGKAKQLIEGS